MEIFKNLVKCGNEFCEKYIKGEEKEKCQQYNNKLICSQKCLHMLEINEYILRHSGKFVRQDLLNEVQKHFLAFEEELRNEFV